MPSLPLALPTGSSIGRQPHAGIARLINCYAEAVGSEQRTQVQISAAPGLDTVTTLAGSGGVRGMLEVDGAVITVIGRSIHQIDSGGGATFVGGFPSDGYVGLARNQRGTGVQTIVVCDGDAAVVVGGSLTRITDPDLPPPIDVCVINRSAIFASSDGRMHRSEIDDATDVDGLDTTTAESAPDGLFRVVDRGSDLIALGPRSCEVWVDQGGEAFGFARQYATRIGAVGPKGVCKASVITPQTVTDTVAWVAQDQFGGYAGVVMLDGVTPRKISTISEDLLIQAVADKSSIVATSWVLSGQGFIAFRLPTTTLVYNTTTGRWHERQSRFGGLPTTWRVSHCAVIAGRVLAGDAASPKLYWLDPNSYDEDENEITMTVRTPPVHAFPDRIEMNHLYLDVVPGVGLATGSAANVDPVVMMRFSRDGETWSTERTRRIGALGQRGARADWSRLGTFDQATLEFTCSAAVARGFLGANWDGGIVAA